MPSGDVLDISPWPGLCSFVSFTLEFAVAPLKNLKPAARCSSLLVLDGF